MNPLFLPASIARSMTEEQAGILKAQGRLPLVVNDVFLNNFILQSPGGGIRFRPERVQISYGGSGSGKSDFKATELLIKAMTQPYFRLLYSRKFAAQIRDSQFLLFKDLIKRYGLSEYFEVRESMDIRCLLNGNMMIAAGLDDVDKLKSIPDITDIWIEEPIDRKGSVLESDFLELDRRLRSDKASNHIHLTFNPVSKQSWIYRLLFEKQIFDTFALKTTYRDNLFLPENQRLQFEALQKVNPVEWDIYANGNWGSDDDLENRLYSDEAIENFFTNSFVHRPGDRYLTADIAFEGADQFVIMVWDGWVVVDVHVIPKSDGPAVLNKIRTVKDQWAVPGHHITFDASGLGGFLTGFLRSAIPFTGGATPVAEDRVNKTQASVFKKPTFRNLRAQAFWYLRDRLDNCEAFFDTKSLHLHDTIAQELRAIKKVPMPDGGKLQIIPKSEIKEMIGRSPDFADCLSMRSVFDLQPRRLYTGRTVRSTSY